MARTVVVALGLVLIALGVAAGGALLLIAGLASGGRDWTGSGAMFTAAAVAVGWTVLAGGLAVWSARRRASWGAGLACVVLGLAPALVVVFR